MSDNKKYYYLKLKETFFDCEDLKIIEGMENGRDYSNLYLKMILLSLKDEGRLLFKGRIPYDEKMLSTITSIPLDTVRCGIKILADYGMIEILESGVMYMSDIQDLIGTGSTEAERKAKYRKRINEEKAVVVSEKKPGTDLGQCPGQNPPELKTESEQEKELKKKKETKKNPPAKRRTPPPKDPRYAFGKDDQGKPTLCQCIEDSFRAVQEWEGTAFSRERKEVKRIAGYAYDAAPDDPAGYCGRLLHCLLKIKKNRNGPYSWMKDTPFTPSGLTYKIYLRLKEAMGETKLPDIEEPEDKETSQALEWYFKGRIKE